MQLTVELSYTQLRIYVVTISYPLPYPVLTASTFIYIFDGYRIVMMTTVEQPSLYITGAGFSRQ